MLHEKVRRLKMDGGPTGTRSGTGNKSVRHQRIGEHLHGTLTIHATRLFLSSPPAGGED
ncbi:MAG: hypothetical protein LZF62_380144 [Nitrospira sp.]|nr:MAG: hypothetical protein LZF62_380144 [Nitrospira sp.]